MPRYGGRSGGVTAITDTDLQKACNEEAVKRFCAHEVFWILWRRNDQTESEGHRFAVNKLVALKLIPLLTLDRIRFRTPLTCQSGTIVYGKESFRWPTSESLHLTQLSFW